MWHTNCLVPHPLGEYLEEMFPGITIAVYWTPYGLYVDDFVIPAEVQSTSYQVLRTALKYADYSGETLYGSLDGLPGYPDRRRALRRLYEIIGGGYDEKNNVVVYPPERAWVRYEPLNRGEEKYLGIL